MSETSRQIAARERRERKSRLEAARAATIAVVQSGVCPECGSGIERNLALSGWYQCEQYGAISHRARPDDPSCSWQGFTS